MKILTLPKDSFDQEATFPFEYMNYKNLPFISTAYLFNCESEGKIYIMQKNACLKSAYTEKDYKESARLKKETPVRDGDTVVVGDKKYTARILGNYSDAGYLVEKEEKLFYLQDSRSYVGNDVLWWAKGGIGYTTDLRQAEVYSLGEAQKLHNFRETDIPWPISHIDGKTRPAVDMQYIERKVALEGTGIVLKQPEKPKKKTFKCVCGKFISEQEYYGTVYHDGVCRHT